MNDPNRPKRTASLVIAWATAPLYWVVLYFVASDLMDPSEPPRVVGVSLLLVAAHLIGGIVVLRLAFSSGTHRRAVEFWLLALFYVAALGFFAIVMKMRPKVEGWEPPESLLRLS